MIVLCTHPLKLVRPQMTRTVWLFNIQDGCIKIGQLTLLVIVIVLLMAMVAPLGVRGTLKLCNNRLNNPWLLVWLRLLRSAFRTPMLRPINPLVRPTVARLLNRIMMFNGRLRLTTVTMLLLAKGLKHSPLETEKLAEMALGPPPMMTVLQLVLRTV